MPDNFKWLRLTAKDRERLSRTVYTNFNLAGRELQTSSTAWQVLPVTRNLTFLRKAFPNN